MGCFIKYVGALCNPAAWRESTNSPSFSSYRSILEKQLLPRSNGAFCLGQVWIRKVSVSLDARQKSLLFKSRVSTRRIYWMLMTWCWILELFLFFFFKFVIQMLPLCYFYMNSRVNTDNKHQFCYKPVKVGGEQACFSRQPPEGFGVAFRGNNYQ